MRMHRGALAAQVGGLALATLVACSSGSSPAADTSDAATCNPCGDDGGGTTGTTSGHDVNPDGVAYPAPAGGYGRTARSGNNPGSVIQNFKFQGYIGADSTKPLTTISLADYYDPCNKRYKILHLAVGALWCPACQQETTAMVANKSSLDAEQDVVLQALSDGAVQGVPATVNDMKYWIKTFNVNFTVMLDPAAQNLGGFFNASALPWNANIDPRTMEILDEGDSQGVLTTPDLPPTPSYPLPAGVTCN